MTEKCPGCGSDREWIGTYCHTCLKYVADFYGGDDDAPAAPTIPDDRPEDDIQEAGRKALELLGFTVYSLSQDRATRQTPGIADTYIVGHGRTTWVEWKRPGKNQSPDQVRFEQNVTANGDEYHVWRHEDEAVAWAETVRSGR